VFLDALGEGVASTIVLGAQLMLPGEDVDGFTSFRLAVESLFETGGPTRVHVFGTVTTVTTSSGVEAHTDGTIVFLRVGSVDAVGPTTTTGLPAVISTRGVAVRGLAVFTVSAAEEAMTPPLQSIVGHAPVS
jgi:hypothetical protein